MQRTTRTAARSLAASGRYFHASSGRSDAGEIINPNFTALGGRSSVSGIQATVFGSTGFMGRYIVNRLGRTGSKVVTPYRGDGHEARHLKLMGDLGQIIPLPYAIKDASSVERAIEGSNVVINLIGNDFETMNFKFEDTYLGAAETILAASKRQGVERVLMMSHVNAHFKSPSRKMRVLAERDAMLLSEFPDTTLFKLTDVFGNQDRFTNWVAKLRNMYPFVPLIDGGKQKIQPVAVQNVADAVVNSLLSNESLGQTYALGGPDTLVYKEFVEAFSGTMYHEDANTMDVPHAAVQLMGRVGDFLNPMKPNWAAITADKADQMLEDCVVRSGQGLGFGDLGIASSSLVSIYDKLSELSAMHQGERGPTIQAPGKRAWD